MRERPRALGGLAIRIIGGLVLVLLVAFGPQARRARALTIRFVSTTGNDSGGHNDCTNSGQPCKTIQNAADQSNSGDLIELAPGIYTENVEVTQNVTIQGDLVTGSTVNGNEAGSVFMIDSGFNVTLKSLTIKNGAGGGVENNRGSILAIVGCTLSNNHASGGNGGGIANNNPRSSLTIINSTINGNSAGFVGGGVDNEGSCSIANSTISGNNASAGGGLFNSGTLNVSNTIIAGSFFGGDCFNDAGTIATNDKNLIQDGSCGAALSGDPKLGPLQNNGGPTFTQALSPGSPAIDAGDDSLLGSPLFLTTDQRGAGFPRKSGLHVDIGAFEFQAFDVCLKDNNTGNLLQWSSTTGRYTFTRCSDGFTVSGTGKVSLVNGIKTLTDFKSDRRISGGFNTGQLTGNATVYLQVAAGVWQSFQIVDTNPHAACACPVP